MEFSGEKKKGGAVSRKKKRVILVLPSLLSIYEGGRGSQDLGGVILKTNRGGKEEKGKRESESSEPVKIFL